jgi:hypothetical protein
MYERKAGTLDMASFKRLMLVMAAAAPFFASMAAEASVRGSVNQMLDQYASLAHPDAIAPAQPVMLRPATVHLAAPNEASFQAELSGFNMPSLPSMIVAELPDPSVEMPLKKIACVEYARARSGLAVFGDAKFWWARAKNLYARLRTPVENSVMVFTASSKMRLGHVAVVTNVVSGREIRVDQANWQNHGEIDHSTPIMDVSAKNDWSRVRVWDITSGQYGNVYAVSGFIAKDPTRQADAE